MRFEPVIPRPSAWGRNRRQRTQEEHKKKLLSGGVEPSWRSFMKTDIQHYRFNIKIYIFLDKLTYLNALGTISTAWLAAEPRATQLVIAARGTVDSPVHTADILYTSPSRKTRPFACIHMPIMLLHWRVSSCTSANACYWM